MTAIATTARYNRSTQTIRTIVITKWGTRKDLRITNTRNSGRSTITTTGTTRTVKHTIMAISRAGKARETIAMTIIDRDRGASSFITPLQISTGLGQGINGAWAGFQGLERLNGERF
jgi:hypothetical protein